MLNICMIVIDFVVLAASLVNVLEACEIRSGKLVRRCEKTKDDKRLKEHYQNNNNT